MQLDIDRFKLEDRVETDIRLGVGISATDKVRVDRQVAPTPGFQLLGKRWASEGQKEHHEQTLTYKIGLKNLR